MNCARCGGALAPNSSFCTTCGATVAPPASPADAARPAAPLTAPPTVPAAQQAAAQWGAPGVGATPPPYSAPAYSAPAYSAPAAPGFPGDDRSQVSVVIGEQAPARRPNKVQRIALVGGVAALLAVGGIAVVSLTGSSSDSGGAATPDAAIDGMLAALTDEDPTAVLDFIDPIEVELVADSVQKMRDIVTGADSTSSAGEAYSDLGAGTVDPNDLIPGFQLTLANVETTTEQLGTSYARVTLDRVEGSWTFDAAQFQAVIDVEEVTDGEFTDLDNDAGTFDERDITNALYGEYSSIDQSFLMTKAVGGRWYVSIALTMLETARIEEGLDPPDWQPVGPASNYGAATPADAVEQMVMAIADTDLREVVELLPPARYDSLYQYRRVFGGGSGDSGVELEIDMADNEVIRDERGTVFPLDGSRIVLVDRSYYDDSYQQFTIVFDGDCADVATESYDAYYEEYSNGDERVCWSDLADAVQDENDSSVDLSWLNELSNTDGFWVNVVEADGRWFIDPVDTIGSYVSLFVDAAER